ncbi:MAG: hypothetical protein RQM92_14555 [Candidatus Syntrophopropionicum ammoniitolerans]
MIKNVQVIRGNNTAADTGDMPAKISTDLQDILPIGRAKEKKRGGGLKKTLTLLLVTFLVIFLTGCSENNQIGATGETQSVLEQLVESGAVIEPDPENEGKTAPAPGQQFRTPGNLNWAMSYYWPSIATWWRRKR